MAGATTTGQMADSQVASSRLSQSPVAILARVLQLSGAMTKTSAQRPRSTWLDQVSPEKRSERTGFFERVARDRGVTKSRAAGVWTTFTRAPSLIRSLTSRRDL